jgi:hypothetical protein
MLAIFPAYPWWLGIAHKSSFGSWSYVLTLYSHTVDLSCLVKLVFRSAIMAGSRPGQIFSSDVAFSQLITLTALIAIVRNLATPQNLIRTHRVYFDRGFSASFAMVSRSSVILILDGIKDTIIVWYVNYPHVYGFLMTFPPFSFSDIVSLSRSVRDIVSLVNNWITAVDHRSSPETSCPRYHSPFYIVIHLMNVPSNSKASASARQIYR